VLCQGVVSVNIVKKSDLLRQKIPIKSPGTFQPGQILSEIVLPYRAGQGQPKYIIAIPTTKRVTVITSPAAINSAAEITTMSLLLLIRIIILAIGLQ